ncbi:MAG TPA: zf-HC2 domain-containing protein [Gemmatimonadaceae bacterium]
MTLDCDGFASVLADYLEGDATPAVRAAVETHAASCAACGQLLDDLNGIRVDAAALPSLEPSRDLWAGIASRLETRVLPLDAKRTIAPVRRRWYVPAAAAAALVVVTAGVTHYLTRASLSGPGAPGAVAAVANSPLPAEPNAQIVSTQVEQPAASSAVRSTLASQWAPAKVTPARLASAEAEAGEPVLENEISALRKIVRVRRAQLDPRTIAVLEQSIAIIDSAIVQSRAALARDPASAFLATQLNRSLEKKVDLLRTAAQLPAGT